MRNYNSLDTYQLRRYYFFKSPLPLFAKEGKNTSPLEKGLGDFKVRI